MFGRSWSEILRAFFGLSRMSHSVLDVAHPGIGALLVLGAFPDYRIMITGLLAAFAGFTAVFALNDLMDWRVDSEKMAKYQRDLPDFDLDSLGFRHPIAQGKLRFGIALGWTLFWALLSLGLAYSLKPVCALLLVAAVALEIGYCSLLRVSHWKILLSGCMVGIGALAGLYAVTDSPLPAFALTFFIWVSAWEAGGRNIPNDWSDLAEDIHLGIRTAPVRYGRRASSRISFSLLIVTVLSSTSFPLFLPMRNWMAYTAGSLLIGMYFLLVPAFRWLRDQKTESAMKLFNRTCLYPVMVLLLVMALTVI